MVPAAVWAVLLCGCDFSAGEPPADRGVLPVQPRAEAWSPRVDATEDPPTVGAAIGRRRSGGLVTPAGSGDPGLAPAALPRAWPQTAFDVAGRDFHRRVIVETRVTGVVPTVDGVLVAGASGGLFRAVGVGRPEPLRTPLRAVDRLFAGPGIALACAEDAPAQASTDDGDTWVPLDFECVGAAFTSRESFVLRRDGRLRVGTLPVGRARLVDLPLDGARAVTAFGRAVVVLAPGAAAYSSDGGVTFGRAELPGDVRPRSATFVGKSTVVAVGRAPLDQPSVLVSRDAGRSWTQAGDLPRRLDDLTAVAVNPAGAVVAVSAPGGDAVVSRDGARTWVPLQLASPVEGAALGWRSGFLLGAPRGLLRAVDVRGPATPGLDQPLWDVAFTHPRVAVGAGVGSGLYRTTDGGRSWGRVPGTSGVRFHDVEALVGHSVLAVGDGLMWRTDDAGRSWRQGIPPGSCGARWASFRGNVGLVGCEAGEVLFSQDGGVSFADRTSPDGQLKGAVWLDSIRAVAVGDTSLQLTADGGLTWRSVPAPVAVEIATGGDGVTLLAPGGGVATSADPEAGWRWVLEPGQLGTARAHRVLGDGRVALLGDERVWLGDAADGLRAVSVAAGALGLAVLGDGALLVLRADATDRLEPR